MCSLVRAKFPSHPWDPEKFTEISHAFFNTLENQRAYVTYVAQKLDLTTLDDYYRLRYSDLAQNSGHKLLSRYSHSPIRLLAAVFPEHTWVPWRFTNAPNRFWKERENHTVYLEWLARQLRYTRMEDWYGVKQEDFIRNWGA